MSTDALRSWLQRSPHPHSVRVDGDTIILLRGRNKWHDAAATIADLQWSLLEALDADGSLLRTMKPEGAEAAAPRDTDLVSLARVMSQVADAAALRVIDASDRAAARHAAAHDSAIRALLTVQQVHADRLEKIERLYLGLVQRHARQIEETAELIAEHTAKGDDETLGQLATALAMRALSGDSNGAPSK